MRFSQSTVSLFVFAGLCSALPMNPMIKRQDAITGAVGAVVNDAGLGSVYSKVESLAGNVKRQDAVSEIESLVNDTGLGDVASTVLKRDDPASSVLTAIEGLFGRSAKRQDPISTAEDLVTNVESALNGAVKRQDPVDSLLTTVEGVLGGATKRQLTAVGDALTNLGLGSVVTEVDSLTSRDAIPLVDGVVTNVEGALGGAVRRQDPIESLLTTVEGALGGATKRQLTAVGDALTNLGLGSAVTEIDSLTSRDTAPLVEVGDVATELSQIAARADDC
ncbi:hypothetical protein FIBSPDRAFT_945405 [Athelia psychrophila]|uniref:Uncharacterized protein n=1 Tax=Athelia psychrophila TaxID=1759441 RepID=A0A166U7K1_9AGAM|nr:hypothetical protein FIBSPDRAFT_945405 [Fibularhizoctonia sp. CBS 109695]